jgi:predicted Fe-Mo cluster-binding NifX family protein
MKIGVAKEGNYVSQHFGHCEGFQVFDIKDGKVTGQEFVQSSGTPPGFLPPYLADKE